MSRTNYNDVVIDAAGNSLEDILVTVTDEETANASTIYTTRTGSGTYGGGTITTGATGLVDFFADPGTYKITFHDTQLPARISDRSFFWEAISGDVTGGGITSAQIESLSGAKISAGTIAAAALTDGTITSAKLAAGSVVSSKIQFTPVFVSQAASTTNMPFASWQTLINITPVETGRHLILATIVVTNASAAHNVAQGKFSFDTDARASQLILQAGTQAATCSLTIIANQVLTAGTAIQLQGQRGFNTGASGDVVSRGATDTWGQTKCLLLKIGQV